MRKILAFMHVSLDGFAAGPQGEMDWIHVDDEIFDYVGDRTSLSDAALYGRVTWEMMEGYWPTAADQPNASKHDIEHARWYNSVQKVVISKSMQGQQKPNTKFIGNDLEREIAEFKRSGEKDVLIFGSPSASHSLMKLDAIDEYWLFVNPILVGAGTSFFSEINGRVKLKLIKTHAFKSGVVCMHYGRDRS
ncbi:dihydrofolate reductase family protein [Chryseolinea lacunae]|uniref:Dihydrofolate reductase family protein n=1 Tax=Chryseolinea lacunae TaxID=2801331 RepID=A0ABS1KZ99_9BACT|nr:dihydrofolate reductase family protein [Chryseolinea lacunae]MBL0744665.1 dihydrofolate reductase family protein [Chryseolinea lacunae]